MSIYKYMIYNITIEFLDINLSVINNNIVPNAVYVGIDHYHSSLFRRYVFVSKHLHEFIIKK